MHGLHALCGHLERAELEVEVKDCLDVHKAFGGVWNPDLESEEEQLLNTILWEASILSHEEGKGVVTIWRLSLRQEDLERIHFLEKGILLSPTVFWKPTDIPPAIRWK